MPDHDDLDAARGPGRSAHLNGGAFRRSESVPLDRSTQDRIGFALRSLYDGLMDEPVPNRLTDLIRRLDRGQGG
ncbi:NepR family anti-sigma factor [Salinarimonas soli]|uniref:Anti-sigma factor NepR domain-containing protein n=1 Tax=Salinarimonas soli TaxID=1638099 RepID=A0A5B2VGJ2_9HYPH|nr:NepR family anti-sigma factor [Salinarimonas soli]KAA2238035.1 hypothetical protein F0L46_07120 [Salinarimonas soli]